MTKKIVVLALFFGLFICSSALSFQFKDYDEEGILSGAKQEGIKSSKQISAKTWLMILGAFSVPAFLYLILFGITGGSISLPETLENILTKVSVGILITTIFLFLYYMTAKSIFIVMVFIGLGFILYATAGLPVYRRLQKEFMKKYGKPSSEDAWICRKCGTENVKLYAECQECGTKSGDESKESSSVDTWVCSECGWKNPVSDSACNRCGYRSRDE